MTDYGHNFDTIGQKAAFNSRIHQFLTELESKHAKDFKTFDEYTKWHESIVNKYKDCFNTKARQDFLNAHA